MTGIGKHWNGRVFGTNTGNVALTLTGEDDALTGTIRLADDSHGIAVYDVRGSFEGGKLALSGEWAGEAQEGMIYGALTVEADLSGEGRLDGQWSTTVGTGGTFILWPHDFATVPAKPNNVPEQMNTATRTLGAIRLYADDIRILLAQLVKDFNQKRAIISYYENGTEKNLYADEFEKILDNLPKLSYLKIFVQEPELYNLNRNATIELSAWGENIIRVQSVQEAWAMGKAETLSNHASGYQRKIATHFRKFGLSVNVLITVAVLAALPGLPSFLQRLLFAFGALGVQSLITFMHRRYVPNFILYPNQHKATVLGKVLPSAISWGLTALGGVASAVIYGVLKGELSNTPLSHTIRALLP